MRPYIDGWVQIEWLPITVPGRWASIMRPGLT
jgi:hypothetical protein